MLPSFSYVRPRTVAEAARLLAAPGARAHAGGTDLLGCLRDRVFTVEQVVSLHALSELRGIAARADGGLRVGALTTLAELAAHPVVRARFAALAEGAASAASPQVRQQGTLGGNLCQRPRCWYFRGPFACARKGGDTCYAMRGENEHHAILGGSPCFIVHPSDTAAPLVALDARLRLVGPAGERTVPAEEFFVLPGQDVTRENVLRPGELVAEVFLPAPGSGARSRYVKARARAVWDFALAGVALALEMEGGAVRRARIVLSGVAPKPWRAPAAEAELQGRRLEPGTARRAAQAAVRDAEPLEQNAYKIELTRRLVEATLLAQPE